MSRLDKGLLLVLFTLLGVGLVQVYSSSFIFAIESRGDGLYFFKKQLIFTVVAIGVLLCTALAPWRWIERWGFMVWILAAFGVAATYIPGVGTRRGGAIRWIDFPFGLTFEPSELLKISLSLLIATYVSRDQEALKGFKWPTRILSIAIPLFLTLKQPDFGSFAICLLVLIAMLFAFGLKWRYIISAATAVLPAFYFLVMNVPYRRARILAFLDPWADPAQKGFQVIQSMLSFHRGGLTGVGLGQGQGKLFFLPEAHTDFTLAVLGEEMGFFGFLVVIGLYGYLVFRGLQLAARTESAFSKALALGLSLTFGLSVFINIGVVLGLLPTKGLTLPFLSYGGSSLMMNCFLFGLLLNAERHERSAMPSGRKAMRMSRGR